MRDMKWGIAGLAIALALTLTAAAMPGEAWAIIILKKEPAEGALRSRERVLVDDGTCPAGQIKELIGGSNRSGAGTGQERRRRCIAR